MAGISIVFMENLAFGHLRAGRAGSIYSWSERSRISGPVSSAKLHFLSSSRDIVASARVVGKHWIGLVPQRRELAVPEMGPQRSDVNHAEARQRTTVEISVSRAKIVFGINPQRLNRLSVHRRLLRL